MTTRQMDKLNDLQAEFDLQAQSIVTTSVTTLSKPIMDPHVIQIGGENAFGKTLQILHASSEH